MTGISRFLSALAADIIGALRSRPLLRYYTRPLSTCAGLVHDSETKDPYLERKRDDKAKAADDLGQVRAMAMMISSLYFVVGGVPVWVARDLMGAPRTLLAIIGTTVIMVPAGVVAVAQIAPFTAAYKRLLARLADGELGRKLAVLVWVVSLVAGCLLGPWFISI
ncbi:MAG: hypothetical protein J7518_19040 [Nocardioidaceae bacterium]|nr:hypothetical protein [Nocardioidaceae bacterium]